MSKGCNMKNAEENVGGLVQVESPNVQYSKEYIDSTIDYPINYATSQNNTIVVYLQLQYYYY